MSGKPEPKTTVREWLFRGVAAIVGAALAIGVNVSSEQINRSIAEAPPPIREECVQEENTARVGHQDLRIFVSEVSENCWQTSLDDIRPGDSFDVLIAFQNTTGQQVDDATAQAYLPGGYALVPSSTTWGNNRNPEGVQAVSDSIADEGMNLGSYLDGANFWIIFEVQMLATTPVECELTVAAISARLSHAPEPDNTWRSAAIVQPARC
jgi:hypothetical protein